jgi:hypothetical protein
MLSALSGAQSLYRPPSLSSLVPIYHTSNPDTMHVRGATYSRGMAECIQDHVVFVRKRLSPNGYDENSLITQKCAFKFEWHLSFEARGVPAGDATELSAEFE